MDIQTEFAELLDRKNVVEAELKLLKSKLEQLEPQMLDWFTQSGLSSAKLKDGRTVYLRRELWAGKAKGVSTEDAISVLAALGLKEFYGEKIDTQKLSAYCREVDRDGGQLPQSFAGVITVAEKFKVGTRRPGAKSDEEE